MHGFLPHITLHGITFFPAFSNESLSWSHDVAASWTNLATIESETFVQVR